MFWGVRFGDNNDNDDDNNLNPSLPSLRNEIACQSNFVTEGDMNAMGMFVSCGGLHTTGQQGWFRGRKLKMSNQKTNRKRLQTSSRIFVRRGARESPLSSI